MAASHTLTEYQFMDRRLSSPIVSFPGVGRLPAILNKAPPWLVDEGMISRNSQIIALLTDDMRHGLL